MSYNLTSMASNSTGLLSFAQNLNDILMFGLLGLLFLMSFSAVVFISFIYTTNNVQKSYVATSFISFIISIFLLAMGLLPLWGFIMALVAASIGLAFTFMDR